ncbi:hypothetical protein [Streptomyces sp. NPDC004270]
MPRNTPSPRVCSDCSDCDGFPVVAITIGGRHRDGSRTTIRVSCRACEGTGVVPTLRALLNDAATAAFLGR